MFESLANGSALIEAGGEISVGPLASLPCIAVATDESSCLAMLRRRPGESLDQLFVRLDMAIQSAWENNTFIHKINAPAPHSTPYAKRRR